MIKTLVDQWYRNKDRLEEALTHDHPSSYKDLLHMVVENVLIEPIGSDNLNIDPGRIYVIDDGDYQGTQIFVVGLECYQPTARDYLWFANMYGSCSVCDTLKAIRAYDYSDGPPAPDQIAGYMSLALHMIQRMKWLDNREEKDE